ncbi:MAG TPA: hypothetical protein VFS78_13900 [Vicinamibacteria bacterium]|nr:hypothetical protein [Vicinamibacteria bacterium]
MASGGTCPQCARPVAAAKPRCVYCGGELPADAVQAAAAARAALEAQWAREGATSTPSPATGGAPDTPTPPRVLLVLEIASADEGALARALSLSAFEAGQRRRRGGPDLHRILPAAQATEEAARLRAHGLEVLEIAEDEVRRSEPVTITRGSAEAGALALDGDEGPLRVAEADLFLIVRGVITREYQSTPEARLQRRLATLDPGYRVHLHRRGDARPVELDPAALDFGPGGAPSGAQLQVTSWIDRLFPAVPRDDSFRVVIPALAPAAPVAGGNAAAAAAALARPGRERRAVLDNLAQFRFHSAWRGAARRRRSS